MKMQRIFILLLIVIISSYATTIYKSVDENGNAVFSDHPIPNTRQPQKLEVPDTATAGQDKQQLQQLREEDKAIRQRLDELQQKRKEIQQKIAQVYAKFDVAEKAKREAQTEWEKATAILKRDNTKYNRERAWVMAKNYEQAKARYNKVEQELAKLQTERNSLK